jgi:nucleotide-binding universal stress UspA family protein
VTTGESEFELGTDGPATLVVGLDGSDTAWRALHYAVGQARRQGSRVVAVYAQHTPTFVGAQMGSAVAATEEADAAYREELRGQVEALGREHGVPTQLVLVFADPVLALAKVADEVRADAIVVGASEQAGHRLFGSVAVRIVRAGNWPVTVVP